jgi:hypothetical protein
MWGGLTPQERKGTIKVPHGSRETHRMGCACSLCRDFDDKESKPIDINRIPNMGESFDAKGLLYELSS